MAIDTKVVDPAPVRPRRRNDVSIIVPVTERADPLVGLYHEYAAPFRQAGMTFEFVFVAEPWADELTDPLEHLVESGEPVRVYHAGQRLGEAATLKVGASESTGGIIVTLPAYRRVEADSLLRIVERVRDGIDVVVARRDPSRESWINRMHRRLFHMLLRLVAPNQFRDVGCGVRAMRRRVLIDLPLYGDFFRFLPILAQREGYRVEEVPLPQHARDRQPRAYRPGVYARRLVDLTSMLFLHRFIERPLRFFGFVGMLLFIAGSSVLGVMLVQRLGGVSIAGRPLLLVGVLLVVLGVQAFALGLVGEIIVHLHASSRPTYRVSPGHDDDQPVPVHDRRATDAATKDPGTAEDERAIGF